MKNIRMTGKKKTSISEYLIFLIVQICQKFDESS